jgi:hypothetical protein
VLCDGAPLQPMRKAKRVIPTEPQIHRRAIEADSCWKVNERTSPALAGRVQRARADGVGPPPARAVEATYGWIDEVSRELPSL